MSSRPLLIALMFVLAGLVAAGVWWLGRGAELTAPLSPPGADDVRPVGHAPTHGATVDPASPEAARAVQSSPRPAPREQRRPADLADHVTAWLKVVDADSGAAIPGAAVYRFAAGDEAAIAYSDATGIAPLPLVRAGQLIVARAGYLLRLAPTQLGSSATAPQVVQLQPDRFCARCQFRFRNPDGSSPDLVMVRFRPQRGDQADQPMPKAVREASEFVQRAWREQRTLAAVRAVPELHVQLGFVNNAFVHELAADDEVAFVESGLFELDAATADGFAARAVFDTAAVARAPLTVRLRPGAAIAGVLRDAAGQPVANASVAITGSDPLRLMVRSQADGAFSIGPLADGSYGLEVRHRDHEVAHAGPFPAGERAAAITMVALPESSVRGRVLEAGQHTPLAGAHATAIDPAGQPVTVETDTDGWFALRASGTESVRLNIAADGFLSHGEFVTPGTPAFDVELWPRDAELRRTRGLTAMLRGTVVDEVGRGLGGVGVTFEPAVPAAGIAPGRRFVSGGALSLATVVRAGSDGSFQLEVGVAGAGVVVAGIVTPDNPGTPVEVHLGGAVEGIRVVVRRR